MGIGEIRWEGPKPLKSSGSLVGRGRELRELYDRCRSYDLVLVTAASGVGKTSFISVGAIPGMVENGVRVPPLKAWSDMLDEPVLAEGPDEDSRAEILYRLLIGVDPAPDGRSPVEVIDSMSGRELTVVFIDQTEELLRYQRALGVAFLELVGRVARGSGVPHVVIARSEFRERLNPVEVRGASVWNLPLSEISAEGALRSIVETPASEAGVTVDPDATDLIVAWWKDARSNPGVAAYAHSTESGTLGDVGLLHLQSLLWSIKDWAVKRGLDDRITRADLIAFAVETVPELDELSPESAGERMIVDAILRYLEDTIDSVTRDPSVDGKPLRWANGPQLMLSRIGPALSSAGYKIPQTLSSLLPLALGPELGSVDAEAMARDPGAAIEAPDRLNGAGIMTGESASEIVAEMRRALDSILEALCRVNVLRRFSVRDDPIFELVHDGMGAPLKRWARKYRAGALATVGVIAGEPGGQIRHSIDPLVVLGDDGSVAPAWGAVEVTEEEGRRSVVLEHLEWASNLIEHPPEEGPLRLEDVVFRNCNFTGAAFVGCELRRVLFDGCTMKGVVFLGCGFQDVQFDAAGTDSESMEGFTVKGPAEGAEVSFRNLDGPAVGMFLSGLGDGVWRLRDCDIRHFVMIPAEGADNTVLVNEGSELKKTTIDDRVDIEGARPES